VTVADALISSVKVSAALTWEPKQIYVTKSPGWRCWSVNQVAGRWTTDRWGWHWISASLGQVLNGGLVRAVTTSASPGLVRQ